MKRDLPTVNQVRLARRKLRSWAVAAHERLRRACGRKRVDWGHTPDEFQVLINGLTNRKRNRWARACYPGLGHRDAELLLRSIAG